MMHLAALPVLLPFFAAVFVLFPCFNDRLPLQRLLTQAFLLALVFIATVTLHVTLRDGPIAYAMGDWQAPFGIFLLADSMSAFMVLRIHGPIERSTSSVGISSKPASSSS